jgi:gluconokinase
VILIVAGVSGCGKTTVGALLAGRLRWQFADADTFHPEANIDKMRAGIPLTDEDRQPWLRAVQDWIDARIAEGQSAVITCSALKRAYRAELLDGRPSATMVFLIVSREVLDRRLLTRPGHFFPEKLLVRRRRLKRRADRRQDHRHPLARRRRRPGRRARYRGALSRRAPADAGPGRQGVAWSGEAHAGPA